ncbi:histidine kinase [Pseudoalteromonas luteoviolacea]|uniref:sensor histidine kinase n=1 Tax=Pseudoalteromonas luteoviolacea TaxID=43657 RepID=UPI001EEE8BCC|nr:histidine kinase [Pseudoalteromonas luteoviolacea]MCF6439240.1 histidine kinase [Pseudoalteromonas luteoviolacea]
MTEIHLNNTEKLLALVIMALVSLAISFTDWIQRGMAYSSLILYSSLLCVLFMYWLPMIISYLGINILKINNWLAQISVFYFTVVMGCYTWGSLRSLLLSIPALTITDAVFVALPWSIGIFMLCKFYLNQKHLKDEQLLRKQAEIKVLHGQLNPHFLFNSLNTISALTVAKPKTAQRLVHSLSTVLRYSINNASHNNAQNKTVSLADELVAINQWCKIETARFGKDVTFEFDIQDNLLNAQLPAMILQPLLENALKHCVSKPLTVKVSAINHGHSFTISIEDNGQGFAEHILSGELDTGLGLAITQSRLRLEMGTQLELSNVPSGGAKACFTLSKGAV